MPAKPRRPGPARAKAKPVGADSAEQRLVRLEKLMELLLQASLRGRLLPNERRAIKRHLEQRRVERRKLHVLSQASEGPRCPACRLTIPDEKEERCPHCSVLLAVARKSRRGR